MDDVKAIQTLNDLDEAGLTDEIEALATGSEGADAMAAELIEKAEDEGVAMTPAMKRKLKAAVRILGPGLAKKALKGALANWAAEEEEEPEHRGKARKARDEADDEEETAKRRKARKARGAAADDEDEEGEEEDEGELKARKRRKAHKARFHEGGPEEPEFAGKSGKTKLHKNEDGSYDLTGIPPAARGVVRAVLTEMVSEQEALREEVAKSADELAALRDQRERETFIRKAADLSHLPGMRPDDMAATLRKASKFLSAEEYKRFDAMLRGANAALAKSVAFGEIGSEQQGGEADSPEAELASRATELQKADPKLTREAARARVLKSDTGLMDRLNKAQDRRIRAAQA